MFRKVLWMDLKRGFFSRRFVLVLIMNALLLFASAADEFIHVQNVYSWQEKQSDFGAVDWLHYIMTFDAFKTVIVLLLTGLYAGSFCREENSRYLRMILSRTDVSAYTRSKFLSNLFLIVTGSIAACVLCCLIYMGFGYPIVSEHAEGPGIVYVVYYRWIVRELPFVYIVMTGLQFGVVTAMCSGVGMLFSAYQPNLFVTIGSSAFLFFILLSLPGLNGTPFDVLNMLAMVSVLPSGQDASQVLMFAWGMLWPLTVMMICCILFERRMKWRVENGLI